MQTYQIYGVEALIRVVCHFGFIYSAFWGVQSLDYERWFKKTNPGQIRMFLMLLSIAIGYTASSMVLECFALLSNFVFTLLQ
ncbi:DUF1146 family protein [Vagococcus elongatus]|uniref:DUF1146 domain-containing protein n=1 Tax=Vagococcus elongatus TaxID=180344 RepID=A0A430AX44_9ENTE|nr:DUF1146 family protein [Vagococcus elongatus]RSU12615.1 hypothetical protein CBF29_05660 [Vagococcus elongatus]